MFWYLALYAEGICNTAALPATKGCGEWAGEGHQHEGSDTNSFSFHLKRPHDRLGTLEILFPIVVRHTVQKYRAKEII